MIWDVSLTLREFLTRGLSVLTPAPQVEVHDLQGTIPTSPAWVSIFLFDVGEDVSVRNRPPIRTPAPPNGYRVSKPPMSLLLKYMITPWSVDRRTDQVMIARVLEVLYDHPILRGTDLQGDLSQLDAVLHTSLVPLTLEERTRMWHAVQRPYRVTLAYDVRVTYLPTPQGEVVPAVVRRTVDFATLEATS